MTGEQAVRAVEIIGPSTAIPTHCNDFSDFRSGLDDFRQAAARTQIGTEFRYLTHGERFLFHSNRARTPASR